MHWLISSENFGLNKNTIMGPLVPHFISNEFNLMLALIIGFFFGFILEQAGFSSTKKLVGLFYGYDFTVLRVFFTAGVTAMVGILLLNHYHIIDVKLIYVNPTFLRSALLGGVIMGAGFIIGGFCPGTSVCAAAIGKMDAMLFVGGSIIGIFAFTETYPLIKDFYLADNMGPIRMNEFFGISMPLFAFLLTSIAIAAFVFTWFIEKKVNKTKGDMPRSLTLKYAGAAILPFIVIGIVAFLPGKAEIIQSRIAEAQRQRECVFYEIEADKLAHEIVNNYYNYNIIDVRTPEEFEAFHLPLAINIPFTEITDRKWETYFRQSLRTNVFYADSDTTVRMACLKSRFVGNANNMIMTETASEFKEMFFEIEEPDLATLSKQELNVYNFRSKAAREMLHLTEALKNIGKPVTREAVAIPGGC
jgi:hypothetical protein